MVSAQINAILIKVAALGLTPEKHLGKSIRELKDFLISLESKYGCNPCGEGGEYETLTLDCPLFRRKLVIDQSQCVTANEDHVLSVAYLNPLKMHLEEKNSAVVTMPQKELLQPIMDILQKALCKRQPVFLSVDNGN